MMAVTSFSSAQIGIRYIVAPIATLHRMLMETHLAASPANSNTACGESSSKSSRSTQ